jgi:hypothetical protein
MPEMRSVLSSLANAIGFDQETGDLHVTFSNGKTAVYHGVPPEIAQQILDAPSVGEALHSMIRGKYRFSYQGAQGGR